MVVGEIAIRSLQFPCVGVRVVRSILLILCSNEASQSTSFLFTTWVLSSASRQRKHTVESPPSQRRLRSTRSINRTIGRNGDQDNAQQHQIPDIFFERHNAMRWTCCSCDSRETDLAAEVHGEQTFLERDEFARGQSLEADFSVDETLSITSLVLENPRVYKWMGIGWLYLVQLHAQ